MSSEVRLCRVSNNSAYANLPLLPGEIEGHPELGHRSTLFFDGAEIAVARVTNAWCGVEGVHADAGLVVESCLLGLNPHMLADPSAHLTHVSATMAGPRTEQVWDHLSYCVNAWDNNYQHFLVETLPRIHCAVLLGSAPIAVLDQPHVRELMASAYPGRTFVFLGPQDTARARRIDLPLPVARNFEPLVPLQLLALRQLRERVCGQWEATTVLPGVAYVGRLATQGMAGQTRRMTNDEDVLRRLRAAGVSIDDFYGKTLLGKSQLASRFRHQLTPIGANLMNYLFATTAVDLHVVDHPYFDSHDFFDHLLSGVGAPVRYHRLSISRRASGGDDWPNNLNSPFMVDTEQLDALLTKLSSE